MLRILFYLTFFISCSSFAQVKFQQVYGGASLDWGEDILETKTGDYIVTGRGVVANRNEAFVMKIDCQGKMIWNRNLRENSTLFAEGKKVIETYDGSFVVTGYTETYGNGDQDVFLWKVNSMGVRQWFKCFGTIKDDEALDIIETKDSGLVVIGREYIAPFGKRNIFLFKTDKNGNLVWSYSIGGAESDDGFSLIERPNGDIIALGQTSNFGTGAPGQGNLMLFKINAAGTVLWSRAYGILNSLSAGYDLYPTKDGGYIAGGYIWISGSADYYVLKFDASDNLQWTKSYDQVADGGWEDCRAIIQTYDNGYMLAGVNGNGLFDVDDASLIKIDSLGNPQWGKVYGGANADNFKAVIQTTDSGYLVMGYNFNDIYLVKTDESGNSGCNEIAFTVNSAVQTPQMDVGIFSSSNYGIQVDTLAPFRTILFTHDTLCIPSILLSGNNICTGDSTTIIVSSAGDSYLWSTGSTATSITVSPTTTTTYSLTIFYDYCYSPTDTSFTVVVNSLPTLSLSASDATVCSGDSVTLTANSNASAFLWSNGETTQVIKVAITAASTYTATALKGGCTVDSTISIGVLPPYTLSISASNTTVCIGDMVSLTAFSNASSYSWSTGESTQSISFLASGTTTYTATAYDGPCTIDSTITINALPPPIASITGDTTLCYGDSTILTGTGGSSFIWNTGESTSSIKVYPTSNTSYSLVVSTGSCKDTVNKQVMINSIPTLSLTASNTTVCEGDPVTLSANSNTGTYLWSNGESTQSISFLASGTATYTATATNGGCSIDSTITVNVTPKPMAGINGDSLLCYGDSIVLTGTGAGSFLWNTGESTSSITEFPLVNTVYSLTVTNGSCNDTASSLIIVNSYPLAEAGIDTTIALGSGVNLLASGSTSGGYQWTPANGLSCVNCPNPYASPDTTTTYFVWITDANGCSSLDSVTVFVITDCYEIYLPNAFSPNNDGQNDELKILGGGICLKKIYLAIYNRWGEKVFETTNVNDSWDGTFRGKKLDTAVFSYYFEAELYDKKTISKKGNISLIR